MESEVFTDRLPGAIFAQMNGPIIIKKSTIPNKDGSFNCFFISKRDNCIAKQGYISKQAMRVIDGYMTENSEDTISPPKRLKDALELIDYAIVHYEDSDGNPKTLPCLIPKAGAETLYTMEEEPRQILNIWESQHYFHYILRDLILQKGLEYINNKLIVNALVDFQAFDFHPAMKNIFRILHSENYITKIAQHSSWDASCDQLVYEVERDYAFPRDLIEYIFKSVAYGIGVLTIVSVPNGNKQPQVGSKPSTFAKPWQKMTKEEKAEIIDGKIEIKQDSFRKYGLTLVSHSTFFDEFDHLNVVTEISGKCNNKDLIGSLIFSAYDDSGKLRSSDESGWIYGNEYRGYQTDECLIEPHCSLEKISKIVLYLRGN